VVQNNNDPGRGLGRLVGTVIGLVFAGIGLTVLIFVWAAPFGEFGSPPLFFRIFASFIAIAFIAVGGGGAFASFKARVPIFPAATVTPPPASASTPSTSPAGYVCPHCGAALGDRTEVSPSGDAKCAFCGRWFNIHRQGMTQL
jgi:hypothetical protein